MSFAGLVRGPRAARRALVERRGDRRPRAAVVARDLELVAERAGDPAAVRGHEDPVHPRPLVVGLREQGPGAAGVARVIHAPLRAAHPRLAARRGEHVVDPLVAPEGAALPRATGVARPEVLVVVLADVAGGDRDAVGEERHAVAAARAREADGGGALERAAAPERVEAVGVVRRPVAVREPQRPTGSHGDLCNAALGMELDDRERRARRRDSARRSQDLLKTSTSPESRSARRLEARPPARRAQAPPRRASLEASWPPSCSPREARSLGGWCTRRRGKPR